MTTRTRRQVIQNASRSTAVAPPSNPVLRFKATEYRVPMPGEWFWADGDATPSVCKMAEGIDITYHNEGRRWILEAIG